ncbi:ESX secretion-associated protein EspG [Nocardia sp. NPDC088792]|uniref:ESX secretion-associated protein EspG n=1 Tax=Nocardia sp. NPDC088792 TaxID=3364332 RepID=UPI00382FE36D
MNWDFTDIEFKVLCDRFAGGVLPDPFTFTSRTEHDDDYQRELHEAREHLAGSLPFEFEGIAETISGPDVFITVHGWCEAEPENPEKCIRLLGARRSARACIVSQIPGESIWHSGGFSIIECDPHDLAANLVARLPEAKPGGGLAIALDFDRTAHAAADWARDDDDDYESEMRSRAFLSTLADCAGEITIRQGRSVFGPRGVTEWSLLWRDLADDGRYVIEQDNPVAVGASRRAIVERLDNLIRWMLCDIDARAEQEY